MFFDYSTNWYCLNKALKKPDFADKLDIAADKLKMLKTFPIADNVEYIYYGIILLIQVANQITYYVQLNLVEFIRFHTKSNKVAYYTISCAIV
jgi:hypothetical protein